MWPADGHSSASQAKHALVSSDMVTCPALATARVPQSLCLCRAIQGCLPSLLQGTGLQFAVRKVQLLIGSSRLTSKLHVEVEVDPVRAALQEVEPAQQGQLWNGATVQCALPCVHRSVCQ